MYPPYRSLTVPEAESILRKYIDGGTKRGRRRIRHSYAVAMLAVDFGLKCILSGVPCNLEFVATSALLHDLGRYKKTKIDMHMFVGKKRLEEEGYPYHARVAGVHGLAKEAAETYHVLGYDIPGYFEPRSVEEKVVVLADFCIIGDEIITVDQRFNCLMGTFLERHLYQRADHLKKSRPRIKALERELMELWGRDEDSYLCTYVDDVRKLN